MADESTLDRAGGDQGRLALGLELVVMSNQAFARYPLPSRGSVVLGRGEAADVDVDDPLVSRRHAQVHIGQEIEVEDLAGINGTFVGGRRLAARERVRVEPGAVIGLGEAILVVQPKGGRGAREPSAAPVSDEGSSALQHIPAHIVIADQEMRRIYGLAALAARSPINVLVLGETGVGKELLAETIHACSLRARGPFLALNCANFSESLLESELFGFERGAFTSATQAKPGLLETASGGTVFLDEVGEMTPTIQARLLRVLEARESRRIGGLKAKPIDVRFVAATNRDLVMAVRLGQFRSDLFFRLNGLTLRVPGLRQRRGEVQLLAARFVSVASRAMGRTREPALTAGALERLAGHDWPGNVRELRNVIDRAVLLCGRHDIGPEHILFDIEGPSPRDDTPGTTAAGIKLEVAELERRRIVDALDKHGGNQTRAAKALGIARGTLIKRLESYGLIRPRKPGG